MKPNRINIRLSDAVWQRLQAEARDHRTIMAAIIETARDPYVHPEEVQRRETLLLLRINLFDTKQGRMEPDLRHCLETLAHFVFYWLTRTEPVPEGERDAAHALGQRRFDHFIQQVAKKLGNARGVAARLNKMPVQDADHVNPAPD